jgi:redox-sensitive bicupin YhaK (pirin superfamily)
MLKKIPSSALAVSEPNPAWFGNPPDEKANRNWSNPSWLKSRFHFSFAEYHNPRNMGFGVIRVLNDDLVQPKRGFGEHPHANQEICTYVVDGHLTHKDSMGTEETLSRGDIQFMTAGRGVRHQEHNLHETSPLRFLQIWISPREQGLKPNYGSGSCLPDARLNRWNHMVSDVRSPTETSIKINQDANIFTTEVDPGNAVSINVGAGRQGYLICIEGNATISGTKAGPGSGETAELERHDAAEVYGETQLTVGAPSGGERVHMLLIEIAYTGKGRSDL